jgi:hypothetical protein
MLQINLSLKSIVFIGIITLLALTFNVAVIETVLEPLGITAAIDALAAWIHKDLVATVQGWFGL